MLKDIKVKELKMKTEEDFIEEVAITHLKNMESHEKVDHYEKEFQRIMEERSMTAKEK